MKMLTSILSSVFIMINCSKNIDNRDKISNDYSSKAGQAEENLSDTGYDLFNSDRGSETPKYKARIMLSNDYNQGQLTRNKAILRMECSGRIGYVALSTKPKGDVDVFFPGLRATSKISSCDSARLYTMTPRFGDDGNARYEQLAGLLLSLKETNNATTYPIIRDLEMLLDETADRFDVLDGEYKLPYGNQDIKFNNFLRGPVIIKFGYSGERSAIKVDLKFSDVFMDEIVNKTVSLLKFECGDSVGFGIVPRGTAHFGEIMLKEHTIPNPVPADPGYLGVLSKCRSVQLVPLPAYELGEDMGISERTRNDIENRLKFAHDIGYSWHLINGLYNRVVNELDVPVHHLQGQIQTEDGHRVIQFPGQSDSAGPADSAGLPGSGLH